MSVQYIVCIVVIYSVAVPVTSQRHVDECFLQPSELGPDWYKVPRPQVPGANTSEISYMHMPCAVTTVFDVGICGCTNLMSYLYESIRKGKDGPKNEPKKEKIKKHDAFKHGVEWEGAKSDQKNAGSLLINLRTGEIKNCPFRASPRGRRWYLIRDPGDHWIPMICANGTVYDTIKCTCVHITSLNSKPDEEEVFVIEEDFSNVKKDNIISHSLGISVPDIDFAPNTVDNDIPFWRRQEQNKPKDKPVEKKVRGQSDVRVTLNDPAAVDARGVKQRIFSSASKDVISDAHSNLLIRLRPRPVASSDPMISSFKPDRHRPAKFSKDNSGANNNVKDIVNRTQNSEARKRKNPIRTDINENQRNDVNILHVLDKITSQIIKLENVGKNDLIYDNNATISIEYPTPAGTKDEIRVDKTKVDVEPDIYDEIFYQEECSKKPIPELGPQYFLYYVMDLGFVPYTCHGNSIYDDSVCACMPSPEDTAFDEVKFPEEECTKRPIPEMGPQFFEDFLFGIGYIPFVCHGDKFYDNAACACV